MGKLGPVEISDKILSEFKSRIVQEHGKLRGYMASNTEEAISLWLNKEGKKDGRLSTMRE